MLKKRQHFRTATLVASTNPTKHIQAKRLVMVVRHTTGFNPTILSMQAQDIRQNINQ
jgi:hypothetical protein